MFVKKVNGRIFGAELTSSERKALEMEIQKQMAEYDRKNKFELDALILWQLHVQLGFGPERLRRFFDGFVPALDEMLNRYEMEYGDQVWLCTHKLKDIGVDVEAWYREKYPNEVI